MVILARERDLTPAVAADHAGVRGCSMRSLRQHPSAIVATSLCLAAATVIAIMVWQGVVEQGAPDPMRPNTSPTVACLDIGVLVFREGLECILVLAAVTASMTGAKQAH